MLDPKLLINLKNNLAQKCIKTIENYAAIGNKNIALLLPPFTSIKNICTFLELFGVPVGQKSRSLIESFAQSAFQHATQKGKLYGTTLLNKINSSHLTDEATKPRTMVNQRTGAIVGATLPRNCKRYSILVKKTFPMALFIRNEQLNNNYFIANTSDCTFSELAENFFSNPLHFDLRQERLQALQQILKEFQVTVDQQDMPAIIEHKSIQLPKKLTKRFNVEQKKHYEKILKQRMLINPAYHWLINHPLSCAWLDPGDYFLEQHKPAASLPEKEKQKLKQEALKRGMDFIYESGINLLWFEFNPESVLSELCIRDTQAFFNKVQKLGRSLKERFADGKKLRPKFFIGTDITSNYRKHPVWAPVKDFYGKLYTKIPSPLDFNHFWKSELLDVFDQLVDNLDPDIPIDGIFFDFEMYHAQKQASSYDNLMDFSDFAWKLYVDRTKQPQLLEHISIASRTNYLMENNAFQNYFYVLRQEARSIGKWIKKHIKQKVPNILIGAYTPSLPASWFYREIMAGLSSKYEPLILATFNTDFYSHAKWLEQQGIFLIHGTALMQSKLKTLEDFRLIPELQMLQFFVWHNRPSRMIYPPEQRTNIWWSSEASPLAWKIVAREIHKQTS